jgi:1-acyl-sn-glycerol-3-phosphate acyltransferase
MAYQPYKYLVLLPFLTATTILLGTLTVVLSLVANPSTVSRICGVTWAWLNARATPIRVKVHGRRSIDPGQSYVIVANHRSHYDVFVLYGWLGIDFKWVMKAELRRIPGLGIGCEKVGHIFIDRSDHQAAMRSLEEAKRKITGGTSVIFFPEGTRSRKGELGRFKKGAFRMAKDLQLPILPVTVLGTREILPPGGFDVLPGTAELWIHEPIPAEEVDRQDVIELMERARAAIATALPDVDGQVA